MPPLPNTRHERFCQELAQGKTASEAYALAGYAPSRKNASRLRANEDVKSRLAEIQGIAAASTAVSVESLLAELEAARAKADSLDQLNASIRAIEGKAKISGLLVQRVEVGGPGDFEHCESPEAVVDAMIEGYSADGYRFDDDERAELAELMFDLVAKTMDFLQRCKARSSMVVVGNSPADIKDRERRERNRQRRALPRPSVGPQ